MKRFFSVVFFLCILCFTVDVHAQFAYHTYVPQWYDLLRVDSLLLLKTKDTTGFSATTNAGAVIFRQQPGDTALYVSTGKQYIPVGRADYVSRTAITTNPTQAAIFGADLNTITNTAIFHANAAVTNGPTGAAPGFGISMGGSSAQTASKAQMFLSYNVDDNLFYRKGTNAAWNNWYQVASRTWTNANFIQNQNAATQTANFKISGDGYVTGSLTGVSGLYDLSSNSLSTAATNFYVQGTAGRLMTRTAAQVLSDIGAAPTTGSGSYIQNQASAAQSSPGTAWVSNNLYAAGIGTSNTTGSSQWNMYIGATQQSTAASRRFSISLNQTDGSNTGSDFTISRFDNTGTLLGTPPLTILRSNGNVGIGNISPTSQLTVGGTFNTTGTATIGSLPALATAATTFLTNTSGLLQTRTAAQVLSDIGASPSTGSTSYIQNQLTAAQTSSNAWLSGSVFTGALATSSTTGNLAQQFFIGAAQQGTTASRRWAFSLNTTDGTNTGSDFTINRYNNSGVALGTAPITILRSNGFIGLANATPSQQLDVVGNGTFSGTVSSTVGGKQVMLGTSSTTGGVIGTPNADKLVFMTNANEQGAMDVSGSLGIGTTSPAYKLDVVGPINTSSAVYTPLVSSNGAGLLSLGNDATTDIGITGTGTNSILAVGYGGVGNAGRAAPLQVEGNVWASDAYILGTSTAPISEFGLSGTADAFVRTMGAGNVKLQVNASTVVAQANGTTNNFEVTNQIKIAGGTPGVGKTLTSDGSGLGTWSSALTRGIRVITASVTVGADDYTIESKATTGNPTVTLPAASTSTGRILVLIDEASNITANGMSWTPGVYYKGSTYTSWVNPTLSAYSRLTIQSDGTNWVVISAL